MTVHTAPFTGLPACLSDLMTEPRWVGWRWEDRRNKDGTVYRTKPPKQANGRNAENDNPGTWSTYAVIEDAQPTQRFQGVGLQLLNLKGFAALDLDNVRDPQTGATLPWAEKLIACGSYSEITPSGEGYRVLGKVAVSHSPMHGKKKHPEGGEIEFYVNTDTGRYITVSGNRVPDAPDALIGIDNVVSALWDTVTQTKEQPKLDVGRTTASFADLPEWVQTYIAHGGTGDRSGDFQSAVNALYVRTTFEAALQLFRDHPSGPASKYEGRLEKELKRSWQKAEASCQRPSTRIDAGEDDLDLSHHRLACDLGADSWDADARFVPLWGKWLFWDGQRWKLDDRLGHMTGARHYLNRRASEHVKWAERTAQEEEDEKQAEKLITWAKTEARTLRNKHTVAAVVDLARSNISSVAASEDFDTGLMLLGTPGGTVDLKTGHLREARREDLITKLASVAPAPEGHTPPQWIAFLNDIFDGDQEVIRFLQAFVGYSLTGMTTEHKLVFLYGTGRNGKSVFLNTVAEILADYSRRAAASVFLNSQVERHPTDLAGLQGARLVVGSELPKGKTWDEAVIKDLTGGDKMTARFMRGDFFDFTPQLSLMIAGNNMPSFRGIDEAIRARVVLVPFTKTIPPEKRDTRLPEKLRAEAPAILRWAIEGCLEWQRNGLVIPQSIADASANYFNDEDTLGQFLEDETHTDNAAFITYGDLHIRFQQWTEKQGLTCWTVRTLAKEMKTRGFQEHRRNSSKGLMGLKLKW